MTVFSVFIYFVFLLGSPVPLLENVPKIQQRSRVRKRVYVSSRKKHMKVLKFLVRNCQAGRDNVIETMMYTYYIPNRNCIRLVNNIKMQESYSSPYFVSLGGLL